MKRKKVSELAKQIRGVSYKTEDLHENLDENSVTLLRANNIFEGRINFDDVVYVDKSRVAREQYLCKGDILVCASSGSKQLVGKAASFNFDTECTFGAFCKVVRPNQDVANYLSMYFQSNAYRRKISEVAIGANINNIRNEHIDALELPIGSNAENEKVVASFSLLQQIIDGRKQQLHKLDELIKSRFIELFGDPVLNQHGWRKVALEVNATLLNGRAYKQDELLDSGKYPVLRVGNFFSNRGWYYSDLELDDDKYCDNGDLLYAWSASFGPQIWNGGKVIYHYHIWKVLVGEAYNKQFLCKLLEYATESLMGDTHGIAMMHLTKSGMEKTEFIVPPIEQQEQFAAFVEQTDKSRFIELFGDPVSNPHGYPKIPLSKLAEIKIGPFGSLLHKEDYIANGHALVNPSHIVAGKISVDKELTVSDEKFRELSAYHLQVGDVVMGRRGEMGRCAVVQTGGLLCGTGSILIRTKGEVTADYLQKIISFPSFKKGIEDMAVGQTMPNLNVPIVSKFQIIQPPIEVQNAYYTFVEQTDKSKYYSSLSFRYCQAAENAYRQEWITCRTSDF